MRPEGLGPDSPPKRMPRPKCACVSCNQFHQPYSFVWDTEYARLIPSQLYRADRSTSLSIYPMAERPVQVFSEKRVGSGLLEGLKGYFLDPLKKCVNQ